MTNLGAIVLLILGILSFAGSLYFLCQHYWKASNLWGVLLFFPGVAGIIFGIVGLVC